MPTNQDRELAASAEMLVAAAAFTLGAVAYMAIEGWMGTTLFILGAIAAIGALWVARWEDQRQHEAPLVPARTRSTLRRREAVARKATSDERELALSAEVVMAAAAFTAGALASIAIEGALGWALLVVGAVAALAFLWTANRETGVSFQRLRVQRVRRRRRSN